MSVPSPLRGFLEIAESGFIAGWAFDCSGGPVRLKIMANGVPLAEVTACGFRDDLCGAGVAAGACGFSFSIPGGLSPDREQVIHVMRSSDHAELPGSPKVIPARTWATAVKAIPALLAENSDGWKGFLDSVRRQRISGWVYNPAEPGVSVAIKIFDNDQLIAWTLANRYRADLKKAGIGTGYYGFDVIFPGGLSPLSKHIIRVVCEQNGFELTHSPAVLESAMVMDNELRGYLVRVIANSDSGEHEAILHFLLGQASRVRRQIAEQSSHRAEQEIVREQIRRTGSELPEAVACGPRVLVIDERYPDIQRDAGSCAIFSHMQALLTLGYEVNFAAAAELSDPGLHRKALESSGITCFYAPLYDSIENILRYQADSFSLIYLHRVSIASCYTGLVRRYQNKARILYSVADLHHIRLERQAQELDEPVFAQQARFMRIQERLAASQADAVITHSMEESRILRKMTSTPVFCVPWAVEAKDRPPAGLEARCGVVFLGHYGHAPNMDAALYLVNEIMPLVHRKRPEITCILAGSDMPEQLAKLAGPGIEPLGHVEDLDSLFQRIRLGIAPLRFGAGIKGKVLEMMGRGYPCIMTPVAAEGLSLPSDLAALVTNDTASLAQLVIDLHDQHVIVNSLAKESLEFIREFFNADKVSGLLEKALTG